MYTIKPIIDSTVKLEGPLTTMYHMRNTNVQCNSITSSSPVVSASNLEPPTSSSDDKIPKTPILPNNTISLQITNLLKVIHLWTLDS